MIKYAIIINEETKACSVGIGTDTEYYKSIGMTEMDVELCEWNNCWYLAGYVPEKPEPTPEQQIAALKKQLVELDNAAIRSVRAKLAGVATEEDDLFLSENELMAEQLRAQIKELSQD